MHLSCVQNGRCTGNVQGDHEGLRWNVTFHFSQNGPSDGV
jgi:hypothetical protein